VEDQVTNRLEELRKELEKGRQRLESLDRERQEVRDTMLRISGAIQVLEELRTQEAAPSPQVELALINP
jgi:prefoldin subunit 5